MFLTVVKCLKFCDFLIVEGASKKKKKNKHKGEEEQRCYNVEFHRATYHDYVKAMKEEEEGFAPPALVVAFNSGIADYRYSDAYIYIHVQSYG